MNTRRIALLGLNGAGALSLVFALTSNLPRVPDEEIRPPRLAAIPATTSAVIGPAHPPAGRVLFEPVRQNASKAVEQTKPPFRLVGIVVEGDDKFAVVQTDKSPSVRMRLNQEMQGWRLDDLRRTSVRFVSKQEYVQIDMSLSVD